MKLAWELYPQILRIRPTKWAASVLGDIRVLVLASGLEPPTY